MARSAAAVVGCAKSLYAPFALTVMPVSGTAENLAVICLPLLVSWAKKGSPFVTAAAYRSRRRTSGGRGGG
jgi:hypothetical protein